MDTFIRLLGLILIIFVIWLIFYLLDRTNRKAIEITGQNYLINVNSAKNIDLESDKKIRQVIRIVSHNKNNSTYSIQSKKDARFLKDLIKSEFDLTEQEIEVERVSSKVLFGAPLI
ncbi:hypothetical protein [Streptococcus uberis]|uniref:Uncharacterized protein n=1 Tax=Streptococcus uberis TaxID=1349 RepID=A0A6L6GB63_STRUB|nr:hypothetical protein [Streptococcus uberis]MTB35283.1 hypothetical protein [Streptococcus uberis]MTB37228.1 hypothetical protein [Streptococcus uberis]MTB54889.1 hypothetical protein [Streptococcus uberis]MTB60351.1 hypothetical protein [Streptococcus uberis]MTB77900.1 hypothetical protein [Streptococcus uberis]